MTRVKVCGLSSAATLDAAVEAGADAVGFVFFPPSPRHLPLDEARALAVRASGRADIVALTVDADDPTIDAIMMACAPSALQLHGAEPPARVRDLRLRLGIPIWKALGIATAIDVARADPYRDIADAVVFDAKPPRDAALPGGNGLAFDWRVLRAARLPAHWILSGGLDPRNVAEAIEVSRATFVDVSSGVESAPGCKDAGLIRAFIAAARGVSQPPRSE